MKKGKVDRKLVSLLTLCLTCSVTFTIAFTTAAFINAEIHQQTIIIDDDYSDYFSNNLAPNAVASDTLGSETNPFFIETGAQLRNLSYLVNLGIFDENDYFTIPDNFDYLADCVGNDIIPLTPIGTDQFPFQSTFIGRLSQSKLNGPKNTCPIISNLYVKGDVQGDVGMFGYIANSGYVGQFILDEPRIISGDPGQTYGSTALDNNPIRDLKNNNELIFSDTMLNGINLTNPTYLSKTNTLRMTGFDIDVPLNSLEYDLTDDQNNKLQFALYHEVSDDSIVKFVNETHPIDGGVKFSFKAPDSPLTPPSNDPSWTLKPTTRVKEGRFITISIGVKAIVYDEKEDDNYFASYILERFKVYYEYKTNSFVIDTLDVRNYDKLIHPCITYQEDVDDEGKSAFEKYDENRSLYVGIVAGRCDGMLDAIGVKKPHLDISRPFISKSLLVGKTIDDDNKKTMMREEFSNISLNSLDDNFLKVDQKNAQEKNGLQPVSIRYMYNYYHYDKNNQIVKFPNADGYYSKSWHEHGNRFVKPIYSQAPNNGQTGNFNDTSNKNYDSTTGYAELGQGMDYVAQNNIRIFGKNINDSNALDGLSTHKVNVYTNESKTEYDTSDTAGSYFAPVNTISLSRPMVTEFKDKTPIENDLYRGFNNINASNCMYFWVTSKHNRGRQRINSNGALEFYLDFEIDYLYFDDTENLDGQGNNSNIKDDELGFNQLTIDVAERCIGRKYHHPFDDKKTRLRNAYSGPIITKPTLNPDNTYTQKLDKLPYYDDAPRGATSNNFKSVYPFAFVKPQDDKTNPNNKINPLILKERSGTLSEASQGKFKVLTKKISINFNDEFIRPANNNWQIRKAFFPCFYVGFPQSDRTNYRFDILGMRVLLSNKKGNTDSSIGAVDFINDNATTLPINANNWNSSKTKVGAKTIENTMIDLPDKDNHDVPANMGQFVKVYSGCLLNGKYGVDHYLIDVSRSDSGVKVRWNIKSNIAFTEQQLNYIMPKNAEGYTNKVVDETQSNLYPISLIR